MKLRDLDGRFTKYTEKPGPDDDGFMPTDGIVKTYVWAEFADADGIWFHCPLCEAAGNRHSVRIGFVGRAVPGTYGHNKDGVPVLWNLTGGTGLDDLQLTPSIQIQGGCNWHGFVGSNGVPPGEAA